MEEENKIDLEIFSQDESLWKTQVQAIKRAIDQARQEIKVSEAYLKVSEENLAKEELLRKSKTT